MKKILLSFVLATQAVSFANAQWSGNPSIADTKVCTSNGEQYRPQIVPDGSGGAIIFWRDARNNGNDLYYNKLNAAGVAVWSSVTSG